MNTLAKPAHMPLAELTSKLATRWGSAELVADPG